MTARHPRFASMSHALLLLTIAILLCSARQVQARQSDDGPVNPSSDAWNEMDGFVILLHQRGIDLAAPTADRREFTIGNYLAQKNPKHSMVILLGGEAEDLLDAESLNAFVLQGGALLVASDHHEINSLLAPIPVHLDFQIYETPRASQGYKRYRDCPVLTPLRPHYMNIFHGKVKRLVTNKAVAITDYPSHFEPFIVFPRLDWGEPYKPFCVAGKHGDGHAMVIGDHSIFINLLLLEADNLEFANAVFQWFDDLHSLREVLLIVDGKIMAYDAEKKSPILFEPRFDPFSVANINRTLYALNHQGPRVNDWLHGQSRFTHPWGRMARSMTKGSVFFAAILMVAVLLLKIAKPEALTNWKTESSSSAGILTSQLLLWALKRTDTVATKVVLLPSDWDPSLQWQLTSSLSRKERKRVTKRIQAVESSARSRSSRFRRKDLKALLTHSRRLRDDIVQGRVSLHSIQKKDSTQETS